MNKSNVSFDKAEATFLSLSTGSINVRGVSNLGYFPSFNVKWSPAFQL